jgi:hypothetical protein
MRCGCNQRVVRIPSVMKTTSFFRLMLAAVSLVTAASLTSCTSPIERRIVSNPQLFDKLSSSDRSLVSRGEIREGMSKDAVFLALGRPDNVAEGRERGARIERWTYLDSRPVQSTTIGMGIGTGGYYGGSRFGYGLGYGGLWDPYWGGYGSGVSYMPYPATMVEFRSGRVVKYLQEPR